jgi:hypothetical protein
VPNPAVALKVTVEIAVYVDQEPILLPLAGLTQVTAGSTVNVN